MKDTHIQSKKYYYNYFNVFGKVSKYFLTVVFENLKEKGKKKERNYL